MFQKGQKNVDQMQWQLDAVAHFFLSQGELLKRYSAYIDNLEHALETVANVSARNPQFASRQDEVKNLPLPITCFAVD